MPTKRVARLILPSRPREFHPEPLTDSGRDTLASSGSCHRTKAAAFLVEGTKPNMKKINEYVERSLMLVTALSPVIGYDRASKIAHYAMDNDLTLKDAALKLGFVTEAEFDRVVDPTKMVRPYVATGASTAASR